MTKKKPTFVKLLRAGNVPIYETFAFPTANAAREFARDVRAYYRRQNKKTAFAFWEARNKEYEKVRGMRK